MGAVLVLVVGLVPLIFASRMMSTSVESCVDKRRRLAGGWVVESMCEGWWKGEVNSDVM